MEISEEVENVYLWKDEWLHLLYHFNLGNKK